MSTRIYLVSDKSGKLQRLVRATNNTQALRHVAKATLTVEVASQDTLVKLVGDGAAIEIAKPEQEDIEVVLASLPEEVRVPVADIRTRETA